MALTYAAQSQHGGAHGAHGADGNDPGNPAASAVTTFTELPDAHPPGVWGPPDSTVDWCEENYAWTVWVAEWWNTVSSFAIVGFGLWGVHWTRAHGHERRHTAVAALCAAVGLGSAAFHGTLLFRLQMLDELPMVYCLSAWWYCWFEIDDQGTPRRWMAPALVAVDVLVTVLHVWCGFVAAFQLFFCFQTCVGVYHIWVAVSRPEADRTLKVLAAAYASSVASGVFIWAFEQQHCTALRGLRVNPQLHAVWHCLIAVNCLYCIPLAVYARGLRRGAAPRLHYRAVGLLPGFRRPLLPFVKSRHV